MHKSTFKIMSAITSAAALLFGAVTGYAQPRFADYQKRAPIYQGCQQLGQMAAAGWADLERSENISCLDSGDIAQGNLDDMLSAFTEDCTNAVVRKLGTRIDEEGDHDVALSRQELTYMFVQHYDPVFREFCSTKNPGRSLTTQPGEVTE